MQPHSGLAWFFDGASRWRTSIQAAENTGDFGIDLAKAPFNDVETRASRADLLHAPGTLELEKADAKIGLVSGNLRVRPARERPQILKSPRCPSLRRHRHFPPLDCEAV